MAPKAKELVKKPPPSVVRQPISDSSLVVVPDGAIEGFQERIDTGIDWTFLELGRRHHMKQGLEKSKKAKVTFSEAFEKKVKKSILGGFFDETSTISLEQQMELMMTTTLWDIEKFATPEAKICFESANCITHDLTKLIKNAVKAGDRQVLKNQIKMVDLLRVTDQEMTDLDKTILEFINLVSLSLCGNYITNLEGKLIPRTVRSLELQANLIREVNLFVAELPNELLYLGLSKNLLSENFEGLNQLPRHLTVLDLSDNDIYDLDEVLSPLVRLPALAALYLAGNPCSVCAGYAKYTIRKLRQLKWLDNRQVLATDRPTTPSEVHTDDLRSSYFFFNIFRVMGLPQPPKPEKGATTAFHVELEIPLLDAQRRRFLFFRRNESLIEMLPPPEDDEVGPIVTHSLFSKMSIGKVVSAKNLEDGSSLRSDVYQHLEAKNERMIQNYTVFESNKVQWAKVMNFTDPTVRLFCPDLIALRNTFRSVITLRLVYTVTTAKPAKSDKKKDSAYAIKIPPEQRVVLATIRCALKNPDWSQHSQHFHWDDTLMTNDAIHWGDGDLAVLQYSLLPTKIPKAKQDVDALPNSRQNPPDNLTCHFGFGIDTLRN